MMKSILRNSPGKFQRTRIKIPHLAGVKYYFYRASNVKCNFTVLESIFNQKSRC